MSNKDFAPVCLVFNSMILLPVEGFQPFTDAVHLVGLPTLFLNACLTFALNLSSVAVIGSCSGLVLTLAGVVKDVRTFSSIEPGWGEGMLLTF